MAVMASVPSGSGGASSQFGQLGKAPQLKEQLYNPDAKLTDLFGSLEPKMMLDAIISTYCKAWFGENDTCVAFGSAKTSYLTYESSHATILPFLPW